MSDQEILRCTLQLLNGLIQQTTAALLNERDFTKRTTMTTAATEHGHGQYAILEYLNT